MTNQFVKCSKQQGESTNAAGQLIRGRWQQRKEIYYKGPSTWSRQLVGSLSVDFLQSISDVFAGGFAEMVLPPSTCVMRHAVEMMDDGI